MLLKAANNDDIPFTSRFFLGIYANAARAACDKKNLVAIMVMRQGLLIPVGKVKRMNDVVHGLSPLNQCSIDF